MYGAVDGTERRLVAGLRRLHGHRQPTVVRLNVVPSHGSILSHAEYPPPGPCCIVAPPGQPPGTVAALPAASAAGREPPVTRDVPADRNACAARCRTREGRHRPPDGTVHREPADGPGTRRERSRSRAEPPGRTICPPPPKSRPNTALTCTDGQITAPHRAPSRPLAVRLPTPRVTLSGRPALYRVGAVTALRERRPGPLLWGVAAPAVLVRLQRARCGRGSLT
ncbi:hypothetical protein Stsp01_31210 [Streptomyces sp. NBRC 13847]|nr:hypothetical protein Stsp01_31210 [Streptomyces sp. NBRC 13847]